MHRPRPPLIPQSSNFSTNFSTKLQTDNLEVKESLSLFGSDPTPQLAVYPTVNSLILALQRYGLFEPGYLQEGTKLVGTGATGSAYQGISVSLSTDGNILAIGGSEDDGGIGATWVFIRTSGVWQQQGSKLVGTGASGNSSQGISISLSADGNTLAVGGPGDDTNKGATWIFTRTDGVWSQEGVKLVGTGAIGNARQGSAVCLSADGNTLAVGGHNDDSVKGATWIFTRSEGVWSQEGTKLVGTGAVGGAHQGTSISLSGNTVAIGGYSDNGNRGATWIFTRTSGVWTQQGSKLVGTGYVGPSSQQGYALTIKTDTLVVGGWSDDNGIGATWVFKRSDGVWTQQGAKLIGTGYVGIQIDQGASVSLNDSEDILITGGGADNDGIGAIWVYKKNDVGVWTQYNNKLVPNGYVGQPQVGDYTSDIVISGDGSTIVGGGQNDNSNTGATWVFVGF